MRPEYKIFTRQQINWSISELRGWRKVDAGDGCTSLIAPLGDVVETSRHPERIQAAEIDWHDDQYWPVLFVDLPPGTRLTVTGGEFPYQLCMHDTDGPEPKVCQPGVTVAQAVCLAWMAWRMASVLLGAGGRVVVQGNTTIN
jgi:hypothetical protein